MDAARPDEPAVAADIVKICRTFADHAGEAIAVVQDARIVFANPGFAALSDRRPDELIGLHISEVIHAADLPSVLARHAARVRGEPVESRYEIRIRRPDDELRWVGVSVLATQWQARSASLGVITDITARRDLEGLKSGLGAIFSWTEVLRCYAARLSEDDKEDLYDSIEAGIRRMTGLIDSALGTGTCTTIPARDCVSPDAAGMSRI